MKPPGAGGPSRTGAGIQDSPHFFVVQQAWSEAGYTVQWEQCIDLVEVAPVFRKRLLMLLARSDVPLRPLHAEWPTLPFRPTLGSFNCLPEHPPSLLRASLLPHGRLAGLSGSVVHASLAPSSGPPPGF